MAHVVRSVLAGAALLVSANVTLPLAAELRLASTPPQLTLSGMTAGGEAVLFGRSIRDVAGTPHLARIATLQQDADRDGTVTFAVDEAASVWVAVDVSSGEFAVASTPDVSPHLTALAPAKWKDGIATVDMSRSYLDFLLVRPKKGAWLIDVDQGSARDDDGERNGSLRLRTASMLPLAGKESPPPHALKKDVLVIIDPRTLDVWATVAE